MNLISERLGTVFFLQTHLRGVCGDGSDVVGRDCCSQSEHSASEDGFSLHFEGYGDTEFMYVI